jgi:hypothetical protein
VAQLERDTALLGLVRVLEDASADNATKANAARLLVMFVRDTDDDTATIVEAGALPLLVEMLRGGSDEGWAKAADTLANLMFRNNDNKEAVVAAARRRVGRRPRRRWGASLRLPSHPLLFRPQEVRSMWPS